MASVPDGMANGTLAGVSPVNGLYAAMVGPIFGGLTSSTRRMVVTTTSAAALATGSALSTVRPDARPGALTLLAVLAGVLMVLAGVARLGRYTRFVSHSVMIGFLTGVAVNIICGQLPHLLGVHTTGQFNIGKAVEVALHPLRIDLPSLLVGVAALGLAVLLGRTPLAAVSAAVAVVLPTIAVVLAHADGVVQVEDSGEVPSGLPMPALPSLGDLSPSILAGALAVTAIVLVQGAGVAQSAPNLDGRAADANRDFLAQGVANAGSGLFHGMPVGGSVGETALSISNGARSRWGGIWAGVWMAVILVAFSGVIGYVAQPTLAALLILAGISSIRPAEITTIMRAGSVSQIAMVTTFLATLFLPVAAAVGVGVALSLLLQLNREAMDLRIVALVPHPGGGFAERPAPSRLEDGSVTLLDVYGSLLYAGSRTLQVRLPEPAPHTRAAVVVRLRGRTRLGVTFFTVVADYATRLDAAGGRLYLSGLDPQLLAQFERIGGPTADLVTAVAAADVVGESSAEAYSRAAAWVARRPGAAQGPVDGPERG